jgi:3-oxoacyl-[acyl-carrier-protein] synthase III
MDAFLKALATHLPDQVVTNEQLQAENPDWDMAKIGAKIGIERRHVAVESETAGDLAYAAACKLLESCGTERQQIDYLLFCTQSPDHFLPTTACILQHRLGLPTTCAAIDFNQGCSGYVYGLHLARALVISGSARNVLLLTGETYTKFIHPRDRSVRVLFGDAGTASLISAEGPGARILEACLGTDGSGARNLLVDAGGARKPAVGRQYVDHADEQGCIRSEANLFMDGQELFAFTLRRVPGLVQQTLTKNGLTSDQVRWFVFHQANAFMNEHLRAKLRIDAARMPMFLRDVGNTVSNTIPLTLAHRQQQFASGDHVMLVGFGVGYSWGACVLEWKPIAIS